MKVNIKCGLILLFCIFLTASYCFAKDLDISVKDINFPGRIYLNKKASVYIYLSNNSGAEIKDCTLTVEAEDGSKTSQTFPLSKDGQRVELKWVPQRQGKMQFKVTLTPPKAIQEKNKENNQVIETVEVLAK